MLAVLIILPAFIQTAVGGDDWVRLTTKQTPPRAVVRVDYRHAPVLEVCEEVVFPSSGLDIISESSFTLVVDVVVHRVGGVERFRVVRKPSWPMDFDGPIRTALTNWRYGPPPSDQLADALEFTIALGKRLGANKTDACELLRRRKLPPNTALHPTGVR